MCRTSFYFLVVGVVGYDSGCGDAIVTPHNASDVFHFTLSTGVLSELKMVTYFFCEKFGVIIIAHLYY